MFETLVPLALKTKAQIDRASRPLAAWIFGPEERSALGAWALAGYPLLFIVGTTLAFLRMPAASRNVLWAEDASVFVTGALSNHAAASVFVPYGGYMLAFERLVAFAVVSVVPLAHVPYAITIVACALTSFVATIVAFAMRSRIPSIYPRLALWLGIVTLPVAGIEVNGSIANSHWYLLVGLFAVLVTRQNSTLAIVISSIVVLFAVTSDPLSALCAPLVALRLVTLRLPREVWIPVIYIAGLVLQFGIDSTTHVAPTPSSPSVGSLARATGFRVFLGSLAGQSGTSFVYLRFGAIALLGAFLVVLAGVALSVAFGGQLGGLAVTALVGALAYFLIPATIRWFPGFDPASGELWSGSRYSVVPLDLLLIAAVSFAATMQTRGRVKLSRYAALAVVTAVVVGTALPDFVETARGPVTAWPVQVDHAAATCHNSPPMTRLVLQGTPAGFNVTTDCARIVGR